jgi:hypothetical protein
VHVDIEELVGSWPVGHAPSLWRMVITR